MSEWREFRINELCKVTSSKRIFSHEYVSSGVPFYRSKEVIEKAFGDSITECLFISEKRFREIQEEFGSPREGDILISSVGARSGIPYLVKNEDSEFYFKDGNLIWLKDFSETLNSSFLLYWLKSNIGQESLESIMIGSAQPALTIVGVSGLILKIPDVSEQKEIATVLSCLDRKIENLRRQNETLEAIAQTLFKQWFVNFEFPNEDGKPYKSSGGAMVRSELGEIPAGWHFFELGNVATNYSETHKFKNKSEVVFINTGDVLEGNFLHHDYSPIEILPGQAKKKIRQNDILYSEIRPINKRFAYVNFSDHLDDYVVSTKFMVVRSNKKILPRLLYLILKRDLTIQEFHYIAESRSGTFPQITFESVSKFPIVIPEITLQEKLMSVITPLLEKREFNIQKIKTLTKTRDVLLPKLMSGKLRITE